VSIIINDINVISYWEKMFIKGVSNELLVINNPTISILDSTAAMLAFLCFQIYNPACCFNFINGIVIG